MIRKSIRADISVSFPNRAHALTDSAAQAELQAASLIEADARRTLESLGESAIARSLRVERSDDRGAIVTAEVSRATYIEFGTARREARPFLGRALESLRGVLVARMLTRLMAVFGAGKYNP